MKKTKFNVIILGIFFNTFFILNVVQLHAQLLKNKISFTHADTLRGAYNNFRNWWDVTKYDLSVKFNLKDSSINGVNIIQLMALKADKMLQIDLQEPMILDSIYVRANIKYGNGGYGTTTKYKVNKKNIIKDGNAYFISLNDSLQINNIHYLFVYFHGKPILAIRPPWDGGFIYKTSADKSPWVSVACQGLGASVWYPCKDHQADEPDSAEMHFTIPDTLVCVSNGRLRNIINNNDGTKTFDWAVVNPINNYCIIPYIGKYVHFGEIYNGEKGSLNMDYWVLQENIDKAKNQFADATKMMKAFEYWFGPYPFYEDGYKLVEAPHLGMEHQSATAYGNHYLNGYLGRDLSGTGWGLKWDFIIVHESGHEWFANNITSKDLADMWIHEGFTNYSETLFTDYWFGKQAGNEYCIGSRKNIKNEAPIIANYNVNKEGSGDMYSKAGNMLHTIRQVINNDEKFRQILRGLNKSFYHQTVTTQQIESYISKESKIDFSKIFDQYLRNTQIPILEYKIDKNILQYRYTNCIDGFNLPLKINYAGTRWIIPTEKWTKLNVNTKEPTSFKVDDNFYIITKLVP